MVKLACVSRASFYRFDENAPSGRDSDMDLRDSIQTNGFGMAQLWTAAHHGGVAAAGLDGGSKAGLPMDV